MYDQRQLELPSDSGDFRWRVARTGSVPPDSTGVRCGGRRGLWKSRSRRDLGKLFEFPTFPTASTTGRSLQIDRSFGNILNEATDWIWVTFLIEAIRAGALIVADQTMLVPCCE